MTQEVSDDLGCRVRRGGGRFRSRRDDRCLPGREGRQEGRCGREDRSSRRYHGLQRRGCLAPGNRRSEEHTSELQSLLRISYAVFCLKKNKKNIHTPHSTPT